MEIQAILIKADELDSHRDVFTKKCIEDMRNKLCEAFGINSEMIDNQTIVTFENSEISKVKLKSDLLHSVGFKLIDANDLPEANPRPTNQDVIRLWENLDETTGLRK